MIGKCACSAKPNIRRRFAPSNSVASVRASFVRPNCRTEWFANAPYLLTGSGCAVIDTTSSGIVSISVANAGTGSAWSGTIQAKSGSTDTFTNVSVMPAGSTTSQTTITANGLYYTSTYGAPSFQLCGNTITNTAQIKIFTGSAAVTAGVPLAGLGGSVNASIVNTAGSTDPCQNPSVTKSSVSISIAAAATTQLIALSAGKVIYVCGFVADIQGSATTVGSLQFIGGTGSNCGTPVSTFTGVMPGNITASVPTVISSGVGSTQFSTVVSNELCTVSAGTTVSITGYLSYVQQ